MLDSGRGDRVRELAKEVQELQAALRTAQAVDAARRAWKVGLRWTDGRQK
jgi:hypothetical protein